MKIEEFDFDLFGFGEVLVKMKVVGLCYLDLLVIIGVCLCLVFMVLGYEVLVEVVEVGSGVSDLCVGDLVVLVFVLSCGYCFFCMEGCFVLCELGVVINVVGELFFG